MSVSGDLALAELSLDSKICGRSLKYSSAAAGAACHYFALDRLAPLPAPAHWALAGFLVAQNCQGGLTIPSMAQMTSQTSMYSLMYGAAGGFAFMYIAPRLGI
jgi:hypothetical protein